MSHNRYARPQRATHMCGSICSNQITEIVPVLAQEQQDFCTDQHMAIVLPCQLRFESPLIVTQSLPLPLVLEHLHTLRDLL